MTNEGGQNFLENPNVPHGKIVGESFMDVRERAFLTYLRDIKPVRNY